LPARARGGDVQPRRERPHGRRDVHGGARAVTRRRALASVFRRAADRARGDWRNRRALASVFERAVGVRNRWRRRRRALALAFSALVLAPLAGTAAWIAWPLPEDVARPGPVPGLVLEDRYGRVLRTTRAPDGSRGGWLPLTEIDPELI